MGCSVVWWMCGVWNYMVGVWSGVVDVWSVVWCVCVCVEWCGCVKWCGVYSLYVWLWTCAHTHGLCVYTFTMEGGSPSVTAL